MFNQNTIAKAKVRPNKGLLRSMKAERNCFKQSCKRRLGRNSDMQEGKKSKENVGNGDKNVDEYKNAYFSPCFIL